MSDSIAMIGDNASDRRADRRKELTKQRREDKDMLNKTLSDPALQDGIRKFMSRKDLMPN